MTPVGPRGARRGNSGFSFHQPRLVQAIDPVLAIPEIAERHDLHELLDRKPGHQFKAPTPRRLRFLDPSELSETRRQVSVVRKPVHLANAAEEHQGSLIVPDEVVGICQQIGVMVLVEWIETQKPLADLQGLRRVTMPDVNIGPGLECERGDRIACHGTVQVDLRGMKVAALG